MKTFVIAMLAVLCMAEAALACGRCGHFSRCRYRVHHHVPKIHYKRVQPSYVPQTIIFNNAGTVPQILSQGDTLYTAPSYRAQIQPYKGDSTEQFHLLNRAQSFVESGFSQASSQLQSETQFNSAMLEEQRLSSAANALSQTLNSSRSSTAALGAPRSFVLTIDAQGKVTRQDLNDYLGGLPPGPAPAPESGPLRAESGVLSLHCASCHGGDSPKAGLTIGDTSSFASGTSKKFRGWLHNPASAPEGMQDFVAGLSDEDGDKISIALMDRED